MSDQPKIGLVRTPDGGYLMADEITLAVAVANGAKVLLEPVPYSPSHAVKMVRNGGEVSIRYADADGTVVEVTPLGEVAVGAEFSSFSDTFERTDERPLDQSPWTLGANGT
jgi:hypothetical protein